jgi:hypothetical protein
MKVLALCALLLLLGACDPIEGPNGATASPAPAIDRAPPPPSPLPKRVPNGTFEEYAFNLWVKVRNVNGTIMMGKKVQVSSSTIQSDGNPGYVFDAETEKPRPSPWVRDVITPYRSSNTFTPGIVAYSATATYFCAKGELLEIFVVHNGVEILGTRMETRCLVGPGGHGIAVVTTYVSLPG